MMMMVSIGSEQNDGGKFRSLVINDLIDCILFV